MKRSALLALALGLAVASTSAVQAATGIAPFGCDARADQTCYFKIYYKPNRTRIVQLLGGMKVNVPGLDIGKTQYCVNVSKPPASKCTQKTVNASYNN
jgi:hypothetical protein